VSDPADGATGSPRPKRKRRRSSVQAIGSVLAGFDAQVFRATRPPAELVEQAQPVRGLKGRDGTLLSIDIPEATPPPAATDDDRTALK
jgi:hypothetical protein